MKKLAKLTAAAAIAAFGLGFASPAQAGDQAENLIGYNGNNYVYVGGNVGTVTVADAGADITVNHRQDR